MKRVLTTFAIALATLTATYANDNINETQQEEYNKIMNQASSNVVDVADQEAAKSSSSEKKSNTTKYIIIGAISGAAAYVVYRRWKSRRDSDKAINKVNTHFEELINVPSLRVIRHKELSYDYIIHNVGNECMSQGATEMNIFMAKAAMASHPEIGKMLKDLNSRDKETALIVVGLNDAQEELYSVVHCAEAWDERLKACVNDKDILTIKF